MTQKAKIVLGLGFGDEGKGLVTDFLCRQSFSRKIVVRFSGGQQCGHNVVIGDKSHVHSNFSSGTLRGLDSYFSEHCTIYPITIRNEAEVLEKKLVYYPKVYINPLAKLTTPADVLFNQMTEKSNKHGSCGLGVGATMKRVNDSPYQLYALDLSNREILEKKLESIKKYYFDKLNFQNFNSKDNFNINYNILLKEYLESIDTLVSNKIIVLQNYDFLNNFHELIFEGSQGILLDKDHGIFPNVTYANTTSKNALEICKKLDIDKIEIFYVTRCYQNRHGNGWMSNEDTIELINNEKEINVYNEWQGKFRTGEFDYNLLLQAVSIDCCYSYNVQKKNLVVTCLDQRPDFKLDEEKLVNFNKVYFSYSPDSQTIKLQNEYI